MGELLGRFLPRQPERSDRFTERARRVLSLATDEAQQLSEQYINPEHILLGLVREENGLAATVIRNLGVDLPRVRTTVEELMVDRQPTEEVGITRAAKKTVTLAVDEARRLNHHYIGTEHLLLGLRRGDEGLATRAMDQLGLTLDRLREETVRILSQSGPGLHHDVPEGLRPARLILDQWRIFLGNPQTGQATRGRYVELLDELLKQARAEGDDPGNSQRTP